LNRYEDQTRRDGFVPVYKQKCSSLEYRLHALIVIVGFSGMACVIVVYFMFLRSQIVLRPFSPPLIELSVIHIAADLSGSGFAVDFFKLLPNPNQEVFLWVNKNALVCRFSRFHA